MTDFYHLYSSLSSEDKLLLKEVRTFMEIKVKPIMNEYWIKDEFPYHLIEEFKKLDICCKPRLLTGLIVMEMARVDPSMATFFNIQNGLVIGSVKDKPELVSKLARFELIGCFALTEPDYGSGISDMQTVANKWDDGWILNGQKKWVGNATWCDISIIWARDLDDNKIKGFIVENDWAGFNVEKIKDKFGLKVCQNGIITLECVMVPKENVLDVDFKDVLLQTRFLVACEAVGIQVGAYELALDYAKKREQFGKPIASFQLVQDLLAKMLANVTACQAMVFAVPNEMTHPQAALVKAFCTSKARETVAWAREIFGANGLSLEYSIGRFFADAEASYTYEGSYQMQQLIIGKEITGISAFV